MHACLAASTKPTPRHEIQRPRPAILHTIMSTTQGNATQFQQVTPPSSFINDPLTPPSTNEKHFPGALSVLALFRKIKAGRHADEPSWVRFQLVPGEYEEIERVLKADAQLGGFVEDKIR